MSELIKNTGMYQRLTSSTNELERLFKEVDEKKTPIDIKKILLITGLGTLSWVSTYSGLLELIKANSGDIAFTYKLAIGFAVAMLMLMIVYILDQLFAPLNWLLRTVFVFGYIFLTIISVGFGFGFYWKFLESRSEATRSAESAVGQVQGALQGGQSRLEQLESTLTTLTALSLQKAKEERTSGNSCPNSRPGDGPRRRMRDNDAKSFSFAGDFVTRRAQTVATEIKQLNGDMVKIATRHHSTVDPVTGTRNAFMKSLNQRLDLTITRFNSFRTDPQLKSIRNNLAERSNKTQFSDGKGGTFKCPDDQLQSALKGVVQAFDQLPLLEKPKISAVEGSEATIEAFRRLAATLKGLMILKMPPSEDELREVRKKAVRSLSQKKSPLQLTNVQAGLNDRDYIPLSIALFVDFCLLLVSINRPMDRLKSLVPVMKEARDGPISGILSSFHATHFTGIREEFSLFQHVVFDWGGHYYVAIPLAANDIQAQYLANLFVSLEGRGIVDRALIPPTFIIRSKLKQMGSSFAEHRSFRLYKFRAGAWSNIVLDAVMGAAKDVAISTANQRALEKHTATATNTAEKHNSTEDFNERSANFASLFDETNEQTEQHSPFIETAENQQPFLEMPRMLRRANNNAQRNDPENNQGQFHNQGQVHNQGQEHNQEHAQRAQRHTNPHQGTHNNVITPATFHNNQHLANQHHQQNKTSVQPTQTIAQIPPYAASHLPGNTHNPMGITPRTKTPISGTPVVKDILTKEEPITDEKQVTSKTVPEQDTTSIDQPHSPLTEAKNIDERPPLTNTNNQELPLKPVKTALKQPSDDQFEEGASLQKETSAQFKENTKSISEEEIPTDTTNSESADILTWPNNEKPEADHHSEHTEPESRTAAEVEHIEHIEPANTPEEKTEIISQKLAALQNIITKGEDVSSEQISEETEPETNKETITETITETKLALETQTAIQEQEPSIQSNIDPNQPELAHIAVGKITKWFARGNKDKNSNENLSEEKSEEEN